MEQRSPIGSKGKEAGFTLLELLVVLMIVGLIAAIATPNVLNAVTRAREAALVENLSVMRRALDDHFSDRLAYPAQLQNLVQDGYLRNIPDDPVADDGAGWQVTFAQAGGVIDVHSSSTEAGLNGVPYNEW